MILPAALLFVGALVTAWIVQLLRRLWAALVDRLDDGCCTNCGGGGVSGDSAVPGGLCWDCRGTGHCHETELPGAAEGGSTQDWVGYGPPGRRPPAPIDDDSEFWDLQD